MQAQQVFSGLKVLTVAKVYAAPYAAYQLALNGADVICIEEPGKGDSTRTGGGEQSAPRDLRTHRMINQSVNSRIF